MMMMMMTPHSRILLAPCLPRMMASLQRANQNLAHQYQWLLFCVTKLIPINIIGRLCNFHLVSNSCVDGCATTMIYEVAGLQSKKVKCAIVHFATKCLLMARPKCRSMAKPKGVALQYVTGHGRGALCFFFAADVQRR